MDWFAKATADERMQSRLVSRRFKRTLMGSLSVSGDISTNDVGLGPDFGFGVAFRPVVLASGELSLLTRGLRAAVFLVGSDDCDVVAVLDTARVVRAGGGSAAAFARVEARVAFGLPAMDG